MGVTAEQMVVAAIDNLRVARELLRAAGAVRTVQRVRLALTSAEGALRHAQGMKYRERPGTRKVRHVSPVRVISA